MDCQGSGSEENKNPSTVPRMSDLSERTASATAPHAEDERLRPFERLQRSFQFRLVFKRGRCFRSPYLRIHCWRRGGDYSRFGLVVRRKLGNAVERGRIKRCMREVFRTHKYLLREPHDIVFVAQREGRGVHAYRDAFLTVVEKLAEKASRPTRPQSSVGPDQSAVGRSVGRSS